MFSMNNLRDGMSRDEEIRVITLHNLARSLLDELSERQESGEKQDLWTINNTLQKVKEIYENEFKEAEERGVTHSRMITEHDIVIKKLDAQIEQIGWQIADGASLSKSERNEELMNEKEYAISPEEAYGDELLQAQEEYEKSLQEFDMTTQVTGYIELDEVIAPDENGSYDSALEQLWENANFGLLEGAEVIEEKERGLKVSGTYTTTVQAATVEDAKNFAEDEYNKADFKDLAGVEHGDWKVDNLTAMREAMKEQASQETHKKSIAEVYEEQGVPFRAFPVEDGKIAYQTYEPSMVVQGGIIVDVGVKYADTLTVVELKGDLGLDSININDKLPEGVYEGEIEFSVPADEVKIDKTIGDSEDLTVGAEYDPVSTSRWYDLHHTDCAEGMREKDLLAIHNEILPAIDKILESQTVKEAIPISSTLRENVEAFHNANDLNTTVNSLSNIYEELLEHFVEAGSDLATQLYDQYDKLSDLNNFYEDLTAEVYGAELPRIDTYAQGTLLKFTYGEDEYCISRSSDLEMTVTKNGESIDKFGVNFNGVEDNAKDFYDKALTAYINGIKSENGKPIEFTEVAPVAEYMKNIAEEQWRDLAEKIHSPEDVNPEYQDYSLDEHIPLDFVSGSHIGYADGDCFRMQDRATGESITDVEEFYIEAIVADIESGETIEYFYGNSDNIAENIDSFAMQYDVDVETGMMINHYVELYEECNGGANGREDAMNCLQSNGVFLEGGAVDKEKLSELLSNIEAYSNNLMSKTAEKQLNNTPKGSNTMENEVKTPETEQTENQSSNLAYINKETKALAEQNPVVKDMADKLLAKAQEIADTVANSKDSYGNSLKTFTKGDDGKARPNKFVVDIRPAVPYNYDTKQKEALLHDDGSPVMFATITHTVSNTTISITAKEDMSNGVRLSHIHAEAWDRSGEKPKKTASADLGKIASNDKLNYYARMVAQRVLDMGDISYSLDKKDIEKIPDKARTDLMRFAVTAQQHFDKEENKADKAVMKYLPNTEKYHEAVVFRSEKAKGITVEVGKTNDENRYIKATNYNVRDDNNKPATFYVNTMDDLKNKLPEVPQSIKEAASTYKGLSEKEAPAKEAKEEKKATKSNKADDFGNR